MILSGFLFQVLSSETLYLVYFFHGFLPISSLSFVLQVSVKVPMGSIYFICICVDTSWRYTLRGVVSQIKIVKGRLDMTIRNAQTKVQHPDIQVLCFILNDIFVSRNAYELNITWYYDTYWPSPHNVTLVSVAASFSLRAKTTLMFFWFIHLFLPWKPDPLVICNR